MLRRCLQVQMTRTEEMPDNMSVSSNKLVTIQLQRPKSINFIKHWIHNKIYFHNFIIFQKFSFFGKKNPAKCNYKSKNLNRYPEERWTEDWFHLYQFLRAKKCHKMSCRWSTTKHNCKFWKVKYCIILNNKSRFILWTSQHNTM